MSATHNVDSDVQWFKELLRIRTVHPNPDLEACCAWLAKRAEDLNMSCTVIRLVQKMPIVVMSRRGADPSLPSIGLNCHMDVVPFEAHLWSKLPPGATPFDAYEDAEGKIYARGSQDMKCVGAQYLCALRRLLGKTLRRTVHCVWVPDEEIGGKDGMRLFVSSEQFRSLRLGVMLDEGLAHPENKFVIYTGERTNVAIHLDASGPVGHGSKIIEGTAADRIARVLAVITNERERNAERLRKDPTLTLGDVTTYNITVLQGGSSSDGGKTFASNVIPGKVVATVDIRAARRDFTQVVALLQGTAEAQGVGIQFLVGTPQDGPYPYSSPTSSYVRCMKDTISKWAPVEQTIFPAATDSRYVRRSGTLAYGFSPMRNTPSLLHDHNEYLERKVYLEGVDVYTALIENLANLSAAADAGDSRL